MEGIIKKSFEEWAKEEGTFNLKLLDDGSYKFYSTQKAYQAWVASRKAVKVKLPFLFPYYRQEVVEVLHSLGIGIEE